MISILMASYNGEKYIAEQIESLLNQTFQDFKLFICDDKSTDGTFSIISEYAKEHPESIFVSQNEINTGSAKYNFLSMIAKHKDDYVMLCDQDDVWLTDKIAKTLAVLQRMETEYGKETPLLVHTDLTVVDEELNIVAPSYREQVVHPNWETFGLAQSLMMNIATGSTICYNRALAEIIKTPRFVVMHDWWLLQTALLFGKVGHIFDKTNLYRQHSGNELGSSSVKSLKYKLKRLAENDKVKQRFKDSYKQTAELLAQYGDYLSSEQRELLVKYAGLPKRNRISRVYTALKIGALDTTFSRKIGAILFM